MNKYVLATVLLVLAVGAKPKNQKDSKAIDSNFLGAYIEGYINFDEELDKIDDIVNYDYYDNDDYNDNDDYYGNNDYDDYYGNDDDEQRAGLHYDYEGALVFVDSEWNTETLEDQQLLTINWDTAKISFNNEFGDEYPFVTFEEHEGKLFLNLGDFCWHDLSDNQGWEYYVNGGHFWNFNTGEYFDQYYYDPSTLVSLYQCESGNPADGYYVSEESV